MRETKELRLPNNPHQLICTACTGLYALGRLQVLKGTNIILLLLLQKQTSLPYLDFC